MAFQMGMSCFFPFQVVKHCKNHIPKKKLLAFSGKYRTWSLIFAVLLLLLGIIVAVQGIRKLTEKDNGKPTAKQTEYAYLS